MRVLPIASLLRFQLLRCRCLFLLGLVGCRSILGIEELDVPPARCASSADCADPTPVCLMPEGTCVQCTAEEIGSCTGATPVCAADHTCVECRVHADCASQACLPEGRCADEAEVAYVDGAAPATALTCTRTEPCRQLGPALALIPPRPIIKVRAGTVMEDAARSLPSRAVTIVADPGAVLTRVGIGDLLRIESQGARVTIQDLALSNSLSAGGAGGTVLLLRDGELTLDRVEISNNVGLGVRVLGGALRLARSRIARNRGGGVSIDNNSARFEIVGNFFVENGGPQANAGAVRINNAQAPMARLEHNSFHGNLTENRGAAIECDGPLVARNNIVSGAPGAPPSQQLSGSCMHAYSIFHLLSDSVPAGPGNLAVDPQLVDPGTGDLHLRAGSPAQGAADPAVLLDTLSELDLDGDRRTAPADIGADEAR